MTALNRFIHSTLDGHVGCFQFGGYLNKAAVDIPIQASGRHAHSPPLVLLLEIKLLGRSTHKGLVLVATAKQFPKVVVFIYIPTSNAENSTLFK